MIDESLYLYKVKLLCTDNDEKISIYFAAKDLDDLIDLVCEHYKQPDYFIIKTKEVGCLSIRAAQPVTQADAALAGDGFAEC